MPQIMYDGIVFDSQLEIDYYKYLKENNIVFLYHLKKKIKINSKNEYTPDFVCFYKDRIEIIETKGFNQFSYMRDNIVHNAMLEKTEQELKQYLLDNDVNVLDNQKVVYKKIKYLKTYGWVDFDFKNPNTIANKRKEKINDLSTEIKDLKDFKKNVERYYSYLRKGLKNEKLTKSQLEWLNKYESENELK